MQRIVFIITAMALLGCGNQYRITSAPVKKIAVIGPWVYGVQGQLDGAGTLRTAINAARGGQQKIAEAFESALLDARYATEREFSDLYMVADSDEFYRRKELQELGGECAHKIDCPASDEGIMIGSFGRNTGGAQSATLTAEMAQEIARQLEVDGVLVVSSRWLAAGRYGKRAHAVTLTRIYDREGPQVYVDEAEKIVNFNENTINCWSEAHANAMMRTVAAFKEAMED